VYNSHQTHKRFLMLRLPFSPFVEFAQMIAPNWQKHKPSLKQHVFKTKKFKPQRETPFINCPKLLIYLDHVLHTLKNNMTKVTYSFIITTIHYIRRMPMKLLKTSELVCDLASDNLIVFVHGWKSFKVYHIGQKGPSPYYNFFKFIF